MQTKIRKYQNILVCAGEGSILFGLWAFVRVLMMFTIGEENKQMRRMMEEDGITMLGPEERIVFMLAIAIVIAVFGLSMVLIHLYIGLSAIREGRGTAKKRQFYLLLCAIFFVGNTLAACFDFVPQVVEEGAAVQTNENFTTMAAAFLMDLTGAVMYFEIVFRGLGLRLMRKAMQNKMISDRQDS